jgi:excisionase family DNA binding protein
VTIIDIDEDNRLLTPAQVAREFGVHPRTVTRWANEGRLTPKRTLGGHRRYEVREVTRLVERLRG